MADWFRCTDWTDACAAEFFRRLKRARGHNKAQYLLIQAATLVSTGREALAPVALELIELFAHEPERGVRASSAFAIKARAFMMLGRWEEAFGAFEESLAARRALPNVIDDVWVAYPFAIARRRAHERYDRALSVLAEFVEPSGLVMPTEQFKYFASLALISADQGDKEGAARWAGNALEAAKKRGPFLRHPTVGVVTDTDPELDTELRALARHSRR